MAKKYKPVTGKEQARRKATFLSYLFENNLGQKRLKGAIASSRRHRNVPITLPKVGTS
jgi:hypothetical protein